ncbi:hypothetical protein [Psychrobium sp. 1_MG-2023]|uniref:hypothetical protein n=1 Tax=Psychrobium sp. 1_MG-2023 TaxID=3062624 RepID=UPI000C33ADCB|nr:hypothetical protein [Psychrobium sp. 1_MG-2023]MDP2561011.1 hypothetical protein [Psychrobium sp. 1_MG-2023]PKF58305.1 hypothetical protein CW748_03860 [Alteromonadales bacterium alter-6D02]
MTSCSLVQHLKLLQLPIRAIVIILFVGLYSTGGWANGYSKATEYKEKYAKSLQNSKLSLRPLQPLKTKPKVNNLKPLHLAPRPNLDGHYFQYHHYKAAQNIRSLQPKTPNQQKPYR